MEFYGITGRGKTLYKHYLNNTRASIDNKKYSSMILFKSLK